MHTIHSSWSIVSLKKYCKSTHNMSISLPIADWLEGHAGKQGVAGSISGGGIHYHFEFFANGPFFTKKKVIPAKTIQMKSSMMFIQSSGWTEIDLILKQIWRQFIWRQVIFKPYIFQTSWVIVVSATYRHKSIYNSCAVESFCGILVWNWPDIVCRFWVFVIRLRRISCSSTQWLKARAHYKVKEPPPVSFQKIILSMHIHV